MEVLRIGNYLPNEFLADTNNYKHSPEQELFFKCFRIPSAEEEGIRLSSTDIFCRLQKRFPAAFRGRSVSNMGRMLLAMGVERTRTREGSFYRVVPVV